MTTGLAILAVAIVLYAALAGKLGRWSITMPKVSVVIGLVPGPAGLNLLPISVGAEPMQGLTELTPVLERFQAAGRAAETLIAAATWTIVLSVVAHGLSAMPLSICYSRRLEAAKEPPAELAGMSELAPRRSVLTGPPRGSRAKRQGRSRPAAHALVEFV